MRACNIYKTENNYKIITQSETVDGFLLSGEPVYIIPLNDFDTLKTCIFEALKSSKRNIPTPKRTEYPILEKQVMKKLNEKSYTNLYQNSSSCDVRFEDGNIKIYPEKFLNPEKPRDGLVWLASDMIDIQNAENKKDEVTLKIIEILNRKYR